MASPPPALPTESAIDLSAPFEDIAIGTPSTSPPPPPPAAAGSRESSATGFGPDGTLADIKRSHRTSGSISRMMGLGGGARSDGGSSVIGSDGRRASWQDQHASAPSANGRTPSPRAAAPPSASLSAPVTHALPTTSPPPPPPALPSTNGSAGSQAHRPSVAAQGNASALEKVLSKTRPHHLPPKDRDGAS